MRSTIQKNTKFQGPLAPPVLSDLELTAEELQSLRTQGTIRTKLRGRQTWIYELRFRVGTRQCRRYLGIKPDRAREVKIALEQWQQAHSTSVRLRRADREAAKLLRHSKARLLIPLARAGYTFHGRTIRRRRTLNTIAPNTKNEAGQD